ncbi:MAG: hypothetical protein APF81_14265 [Desulfosporosinus sp. BRH_c37]|nr:MAG: hypothetical protein APF81_14265 [Desulfosporosinus sp. BRH_c37]
MRIIDFCRNISFELNLFEIINFILALVLVTVLVFIVKRIVLAFRKQKKIDKSLRETRDRISKFVIEIEGYKDSISEVELVTGKETAMTTTDTEINTETETETETFDILTTEFETSKQTKTKDPIQFFDNVTHNTLEEVPSTQGIQITQEVSEAAPKGKKTRAMSMEERWAEYDKRRSIRSTASG